MNVVQIVTLFTPDAAYGGPTRVAINQTRELRNRSHHVALAGAALGYGSTLPPNVDDVPVTLFHAHRMVPRAGFAGLASPGLLRWFKERVKSADVVHVHLARDLVTLPVAALAMAQGTPYVLQCHGMVDEPSSLLARLLDVTLTRRILDHARTILCLNEEENADINHLTGGSGRTVIVPNGVPHAQTVPVTGAPEVLFLARLQVRKRPLVFLESAYDLTESYPAVQFRLVGPDEGQAAAIDRRLATSAYLSNIRREPAVPLHLTLERLRQCSIYVLPSENEPFPMSVLEAMSLGKPVVVTDTCGLAGFIRETGSGLVVDLTTASLTAAIGALLDDATLRRTMGSNAVAAVRGRFGMGRIGDSLVGLYEEKGVTSAKFIP